MVNVFWRAAILTTIIFLIGILLGYILESSRTYTISEKYISSEIDWNDARLLSELLLDQNEINFCEKAIETNLQFSDRIYNEGRQLAKYEEANKLTTHLLLQKKKYALLQTQFLLNAMNLKKKCNATYNVLIYFYAQYPNIEQNQKQHIISSLLLDLKEKEGINLMLIPLPADLNLDSLDLLKKRYAIGEIPAIVINEQLYTGNLTFSEISKELK